MLVVREQFPPDPLLICPASFEPMSYPSVLFDLAKRHELVEIKTFATAVKDACREYGHSYFVLVTVKDGEREIYSDGLTDEDAKEAECLHRQVLKAMEQYG